MLSSYGVMRASIATRRHLTSVPRSCHYSLCLAAKCPVSTSCQSPRTSIAQLSTSAGASSSSTHPPPTSRFLAQVQLLHIQIVDLPQINHQNSSGQIPLLPSGDSTPNDNVSNQTVSTPSTSSPNTDLVVGGMPMTSSLSTLPANSAMLSHLPASPQSIPVLTHQAITNPAQRQKLWSAVSHHALQQQKGNNSQSGNSTPQPGGGLRFLVSKKHLPDLFMANQTQDANQQAQLVGAVPTNLLPSSPSSSPLSSAQSGLIVDPSNGSSASALALQIQNAPSEQLEKLAGHDTVTMKHTMTSTGVAPKMVYPTPSPTEAALLTAASRNDLTSLKSLLESHRIVASAQETAAQQQSSSQQQQLPTLNINVHDHKTGGTILHIISGNGSVELLRYLLDTPSLRQKLDLNARSSNKATALHWAAGTGHTEVIEMLLAAGADATLRSLTWNHSVFGRGSGQTPAHWAAESGHTAVLELLHQHQPFASVMVDERQQTPKVLAEKAAHTDAVCFLDKAASEEFVCVEMSLQWSGERAM